MDNSITPVFERKPLCSEKKVSPFAGMSREELFQKTHMGLLKALVKLWKIRKAKEALFDWLKNARPEQRVPEGNDWRIWLIMAGRGFGKTRTGAETIRQWVDSGKCRHIAIVGKNFHEARSVMVEGKSGILSVYPPEEAPTYYPSKKLIVWPNGAKATLFSGDVPDSFRGPEFDGAWVDEFAKFRKPQQVLDQLSLALRQGETPRMIITTTPKPMKVLNDLVKQAEDPEDSSVKLTTGNTHANKENLSDHFIKSLEKQFGGTLLANQEIDGELLDIRDHALWTKPQLDRKRFDDPPEFSRVVVGVDPAATNNAHSDETGIVVAGLGHDGKAYVLEDLSGKYNPSEWAQLAVEAYWEHGADRIVAETNKGGDMIEDLFRAHDENVSFKGLRATRSKGIRAEPVAALYEKGKVYHRERGLDGLEKQMLSYIPDHTAKSPDRIDALVWTLTELMLSKEANFKPHAWIVN